jgi:hypothetical protein
MLTETTPEQDQLTAIFLPARWAPRTWVIGTHKIHIVHDLQQQPQRSTSPGKSGEGVPSRRCGACDFVTRHVRRAEPSPGMHDRRRVCALEEQVVAVELVWRHPFQPRRAWHVERAVEQPRQHSLALVNPHAHASMSSLLLSVRPARTGVPAATTRCGHRATGRPGLGRTRRCPAHRCCSRPVFATAVRSRASARANPSSTGPNTASARA